MDSLVLLSLSQNVSMLHLLTEQITITPSVIDPRCSPHAHFRISGLAVEEALNAALREVIPPSLPEIAMRLGYRGDASLQRRFPSLCNEIVSKRRAILKRSPVSRRVPLPRERIERALSEALNQDAPVSLHSLAAAIGLRNKRRFYKGFHELRNAVIANNWRLRQQRVDAMESALRRAFAETPAPTITALARRLGLKSVTSITRRFPGLSAELRRRRVAATN